MGKSKDVAAIVVAAGDGRRMGRGRTRKPWIVLAGKTLLARSLEALSRVHGLREIVLVVHRDDVGRCERPPWAGRLARFGVSKVVRGGAVRQVSVSHGLAVLDPRVRWVVVHDAARPLASADLAERVLAAARRTGAAVPGVPAVDTLKTVSPSGRVRATLDRSAIRAIQTPQAFRRDLLEAAHRRSGRRLATDDAALMESAGMAVFVVPGDPANIKITTRADLRLASWLQSRQRTTETQRARRTTRVGLRR